MQNASELLSSLSQRGVKLWNENGQLRFQAPRGSLLPDELGRLRALKVEIIQLLEQPGCDTEISLRPRAAGCPVPLTASQMYYWNHWVKLQLGLRRCCTLVLYIQGTLDVRLLRRSIELVLERHEALRTRIVTAGDTPFQHIDAAGDLYFEQMNLQGLAHENLEDAVRPFIDNFLEENVDLSIGPLFKVILFRLSDHEYVLVLAWNHMIVDGISKGIVINEIWTLYDQGMRDLPLSLPQVFLQFSDFAVWQQQMYPVWKRKHDSYWKSRLSGAQSAQIPCTGKLKEARLPAAFMQIPFGDVLSVKLRDIARRERTLLSLVVLTIYAVVMSRWCSQQDLLILLSANGRDLPELENMVGFIASGHYLRIEISVADDLVSLLKRVGVEFYAAYDHQDVGIDFVPAYSTDLYFNWRSTFRSKNSIDRQPETNKQFRVRPLSFRAASLPNTRKFRAIFSETAAGIDAIAEYRPDLIAPNIVERFGHNLRLVAEEFARDPSARVGSVPISFRGF